MKFIFLILLVSVGCTRIYRVETRKLSDLVLKECIDDTYCMLTVEGTFGRTCYKESTEYNLAIDCSFYTALKAKLPEQVIEEERDDDCPVWSH
jgi:hypothetical protein